MDIKSCKKCDYVGDNFEKGRYVCRPCRYTQRDMDKYWKRQAANSRKRYQDPEKRAQDNATNEKWRKKNLAKKRAAATAYYASKLQRTPLWADRVEIDYVYHAAQVIKDVYGTEWNVDHIIPLRGEKVSGLHVQNNLQLLSPSANKSKANKFEVY